MPCTLSRDIYGAPKPHLHSLGFPRIYGQCWQRAQTGTKAPWPRHRELSIHILSYCGDFTAQAGEGFAPSHGFDGLQNIAQGFRAVFILDAGP